MISKTITIGELIKKLNLVVSSQDFTDRLHKVYDHGDFHKLVAEFTKPFLPTAIHITTWGLVIESLVTENEIATYGRQFIPYKNSTRGDKGNFSSVSFKIVKGLDENMTINRAKVHLRTAQLNKRISKFTALIASHKQEIDDYEQYISDFQNELKELSESKEILSI